MNGELSLNKLLQIDVVLYLRQHLNLAHCLFLPKRLVI